MSQRFVYRASAVPFGGEITRPFSEVLDAQASSSLPSTGGSASARSEDYRFREVVSFDAAYSQVAGSEFTGEDGLRHDTLALSVVEGLNILDMVTADRVVARLVAAGTADPAAELAMGPLGSYFVNLRIGGVPINPRPHEFLRDGKAVTMTAIKEGYGRLPKGSDTPSSKDRLRFSMFDPGTTGKELAAAGARSGFPIVIPGFGKVHLGELEVSSHYRSLTMVRVEMGSPIRAELQAAAVQGDGSPY